MEMKDDTIAHVAIIKFLNMELPVFLRWDPSKLEILCVSRQAASASL